MVYQIEDIAIVDHIWFLFERKKERPPTTPPGKALFAIGAKIWTPNRRQAASTGETCKKNYALRRYPPARPAR
jgi:hypothetical protein